MKKRRLKPLPKLIFKTVKLAVFGVVSFYLMAMLFCWGLYLNAEQMDNKYETMEAQQEQYQINYGG